MNQARVTAHAIRRYQQRVAAVTRAEAERAIQCILREGRIRATPRHWMRATTSYGEGVRFAYSPSAPDLCIVLRGTTAVTIITRSLSRGTASARPERRYDRRPPRRTARHRPRRSRVRHLHR